MAQYFSIGEDPSSLKWEQINTPNFQIIYPAEFQFNAQKLANVLEKVYSYASASLNHQPKKISIILHNHSSYANGIVIWAPKRSELYTIPPQDIYAQDWLEQLAIHEFRHVVQMDKLDQGVTKLLGLLLGEQGVGAISALIPGWFFEGDAVATETALTKTGRGRLPSFYMPLRAQFLEKKIYSLEKAYFGSYKDYVPNHYVLGYHLMAGIRKNYGVGVLDKSVNYVARNPFPFSPFSRGLKRATGKDQWQLYNEVMTELDSVWRDQYQHNTYTEFDIINKVDKKEFTSFKYPQYLNDSTIIVEKSGLGSIQKFITLSKEGKEKVIHTPGFSDYVNISCKKDKLVWWEYNYDIRWANRVYSDIWLFDIKSNKKKKLTTRQHYFSPSLSNNADRIASIHITETNDYSLEILDVNTGQVLDKIITPGNYTLFTPSWSDDDTKIVFIYLGPYGKGIAYYDLQYKELVFLTDPSPVEISLPALHKRTVYFQATYSGIDNIYSIDLDTDSIYQITSSRFGACFPTISSDGSSILYSDYTAMGYNVVSATINKSLWEPVQTIAINKNILVPPLVAQERGAIDFNKEVKKCFPVTRYRKLPNLFNFHSWAPVYLNTADYGINPGITLLSQNKLSTSVASVGYEYLLNEEAGRFKVGYSYSGFFPTIDFAYSTGDRGGFYRDSVFFKWRENSLQAGSSIPLNLTRGKYIMGITPQIGLQHIIISHKHNTPSEFLQGTINAVVYKLTGYRQLKMAYKDIGPRWGQTFSINYRETLRGDLAYNPQFNIEGKFYFPGIIKHHSNKLTLSHFFQSTSASYNFSPNITYPRGYTLQYNHRFYKASLDYQLPVCYPDFRIKRLMYLQRIKANLFVDYAYGYNKSIKSIYESVGFDLLAETFFLEFPAPYEIGFRYYFHPNTSTSGLHLLFSVNLNSL